jgi:hypothetical protein
MRIEFDPNGRYRDPARQGAEFAHHLLQGQMPRGVLRQPEFNLRCKGLRRRIATVLLNVPGVPDNPVLERIEIDFFINHIRKHSADRLGA